MIGMLNGFRVIEDPNYVDGPFEDWSRVRSPGRARRRRWKHKQNIRQFYTPKKEALVFGDKILMHPTMAASIRAKVAEK